MVIDMPECVRGCAKGLLLCLNGVSVVISFSVIGIAAVDARLLSQYGPDTGMRSSEAEGSFVGDMLLMAAGVLFLVITGCGCVGVLRENVKMLYLYVGFLMTLIVLEFLVGIFVVVQRYGLQFAVTDWIRDDFYKNVTGYELLEHQMLWDNLQTTPPEYRWSPPPMDTRDSGGMTSVLPLSNNSNRISDGRRSGPYECCGLNGPDDYLALGHNVSLSCCAHAYTARNERARELLYRSCIKLEGYYKRGCEEEMLISVQEANDCLLGAAVFAFWIETASMLLAMWTANSIKNQVKIYKEITRY
ncbi:Tetraspanin-33 [Eumeta japonica]|uniref:Tetraspanin-33 n=1 Tax=Eumeta variegata TaxID=151549 RepID=A0A4C1XXR2_EUMVA|nr:Tetraspanin-33 [Eumeta japonica]